MPADRAAFGAFLRSRRDRLTPAGAGITPFPGPRRVPGLRKEELAVLAGLSPDHYSRLEQGRQATVTDDVLDALARALQLDDLEHAHLRDLAAPAPLRARPVWEARQRPEPGLLRMMTALDHLPALLLGRRGEVLARIACLARCWVRRSRRESRSCGGCSSTRAPASASRTGARTRPWPAGGTTTAWRTGRR